MCVCVPLPPPTARLMLKKRGMFLRGKKRGSGGNDKSLSLCYWNILTALGSLTFYYRS